MTDPADGAAMLRPVVTSAVEDYLKTIFQLGGENVKTQELAAALGIRAASVTGMLRKLAELKLVDYERYRGASLTEAGRKVALETIRHHRLIETYLAEALGYEWFEVHDEAEKLEHHISEEFEQRIAEILGHPEYDPHGDPIPDLHGVLPGDLGQPLLALPAGLPLRVTRVVSQPVDVQRYLDELGLAPGQALVLVQVAPFGGPVTIDSGGTQITLSQELAASIHARPDAADGS
jgi:DtxR family Mn-dependent transcriptional regulator